MLTKWKAYFVLNSKQDSSAPNVLCSNETKFEIMNIPYFHGTKTQMFPQKTVFTACSQSLKISARRCEEGMMSEKGFLCPSEFQHGSKIGC